MISQDPFEVQNQPVVEKFLNDYIAFLIISKYPKFHWIKDPKKYITEVYEDMAETRLIADAIREFKNQHYILLQKKSDKK